MIKAKTAADPRKKVLRSAEEVVEGKTEESYVDDLARTGVVWAGLLELTDAITPSEVAAMLCCHDLVRATRLVESEEYWVSAAAYTALGALAEPPRQEAEKVEKIEKPEQPQAIGFVASAKSHLQ
jgi:hypothetical protein